jgi:hypothetical protein
VRHLRVIDEASTREVPFPADGRGPAIVCWGVLSNNNLRDGVELLGKVLVDGKGDPHGDVLVPADWL